MANVSSLFSSLRLSVEISRVPRWRNVLSLSVRSSGQLSCSEASVEESSREEVNQQVVRGTNRTIVCYHPPPTTSYQHTRPLQRRKVWGRDSLTGEEISLVRKLREEDGNVWSSHALSRLLDVSPGLISKYTPASEERSKELHEERQRVRNMRRHARKLYLIERHQTRQSKLKDLLANNKYPFPSTKSESTN